MRYFTKTCLYLFFFSWVSLGPPAYAQPYQAQVIDAETKQPIEGAAVLAVWWMRTPGIAHPIIGYHDAQETVTDLNGNFTTLGITAGPMDPQATIRVLFTVFKPGYEGYKAGGLKPSSLPKDLRQQYQLPDQVYEKDGAMVVELRPLRTKEERETNLIDVLPIPCRPNDISQFCVPGEKYPNLLKLVNEEEVNLRLKPTRLPREAK